MNLANKKQTSLFARKDKMPVKIGAEVLKAAIAKQINGDKNHGWGVDDSTEVIMQVVANETGTSIENLADIRPLIRSMVNPSQARQILENAKLLNEAPKGSRKVAGGLASFIK